MLCNRRPVPLHVVEPQEWQKEWKKRDKSKRQIPVILYYQQYS